MENEDVIFDNNINVFTRAYNNLKLKNALKDCVNIGHDLKKRGILKHTDSKVNLAIYNKEKPKSYFFYRGYTKDGRLTPLKKYTNRNGSIVEENVTLTEKPIMLDLFEESVYLYDCHNDNKLITGYMIKIEEKKENEADLIFSADRCKVNLKSINSIIEFNSIDDFIEKVII